MSPEFKPTVDELFKGAGGPDKVPDRITPYMEQMKKKSDRLAIIVVGTAAVSCIAGSLLCRFGK